MPTRLTVRTALDELATQLRTVAGIPTGSFYDYEPAPGQINKSPALTVSFTGMDGTTWMYAIRLYVDPTGDAELADDLIVTLLPLIEAAVDSRWGPTLFQKEWNGEINRWVVTWLVSCGREDF